MVARTHLWRELCGKLLELAQLFANVDLALLVQQHRDQGLGAAGILYRLRGKEEVVGGVVVVCAVPWLLAWLLARGVLEEEDDAVDGAELLQRRWVQRQQVLKLHVLDAELLDEVREDALAWVSVACVNAGQLSNALHPTRLCSSLPTWLHVVGWGPVRFACHGLSGASSA